MSAEIPGGSDGTLAGRVCWGSELAAAGRATAAREMLARGDKRAGAGGEGARPALQGRWEALRDVRAAGVGAGGVTGRVGAGRGEDEQLFLLESVGVLLLLFTLSTYEIWPHIEAGNYVEGRQFVLENLEYITELS